MTRAERALQREQKLKARLEADSKALAQVQAQNRAQARAERDKRRYRVGALADEAGLFLWEDTTLAALCQTLGKLRDCPDPVAVLESLLADVETVVATVPN